MGNAKEKRRILAHGGIVGPTTADLLIKLGDAAGTYAVSIVDSATAEVADINSDGALTVVKATVSSGLGVTGASTFSAGVTVGGTLTASSALAVTAASTFTGAVTVGGTLTASSALSVAAASTFSGNVTVGGTLTGSSNVTVSGTLTASSGLGVTAASTFSGAVTASSNVTVGGTLTGSSSVTLSGKLTHSLQSVSSSQALGVHNVSVLTATSAVSYTLPAAAAGYYKAIFKSANSTAILTVDTNSTDETFDGSSATKLTFNGKDQKAELVGLSTARWLLISSTASVGDIST